MMAREEFEQLVDEWVEKNIPDPHPLNTPVFIRRVAEKVEFFDSVEGNYLLATLEELQRELRKGYLCECGSYHVPGIVDITDPARPRWISFHQFLEVGI
jgi:hypothetical protein